MKAQRIDRSFLNLKRQGRKITLLTAYDAPTARLCAEAGIDAILVGDSVGPVLLGYPSTRSVTLSEMIHHAKAVRRGAPKGVVIGDMPLEGTKGGSMEVLKKARTFMRQGKLNALKIEWQKDAGAITHCLVKKGIPVMGHVGLTPQSVVHPQDLRVRGRTAEEASGILQAARAFQRNGAFSIVLECIPAALAGRITKILKIPTIGIGAGRFCDGQVLVFHDLVGLTPTFHARFIRRYAELYETEKKAVSRFLEDVRNGRFPRKQHAFRMNPEELKKLDALITRWNRP